MIVEFQITYEDLESALAMHLALEKSPASPMTGLTNSPNAVKFIPTQKRVWRTRLSWILIVTVGVIVYVLVHDQPASSAGTPAVPPPSSPGSILDLFPYAIIFFLLWIFFLAQIRTTKKRRIKVENDLAMRQIRTLQTSESGITVSLPNERHIYDWLAYQRVTESESAFFLYTSPTEFQLVPKRAFAPPSQVAEFRQLLGDKIGDRRVNAFPVIQHAREPKV